MDSPLQTLKDYRVIAAILFPGALAFLDEKIADSPNGENEKVIAAESQMLYLLTNLDEKASEMSDCESCGSDIDGLVGDATCRGCGMVVCQSCCDFWNHLGDGLHGSGDPAEGAVALRSELSDAKMEIERQKEQIAAFIEQKKC